MYPGKGDGSVAGYGLCSKLGSQFVGTYYLMITVGPKSRGRTCFKLVDGAEMPSGREMFTSKVCYDTSCDEAAA